MPTKYHSESPYYDDYSPSKGYTQILAVPGRVEQAREFTQQGTMMKDFIGRLGDAIYKDGAIIEGCTLSIQDKVATISSGRIYLEGLIRLVPETRININAVGSEVIGVELESSIVTEVNDNTLLDPAQGFENSGQAGAHRLKEVVVFSVNKDGVTPVYRLESGEIVNSTHNTKNDTITETLARRTFDESGNYKVEGLSLQDRNEVVNGKIRINMGAGKAYIKGFEITKPTTTVVELEYSQETRAIVSEPKTFKKTISRYELNNYPAKQITSVIGVTEVTETITRGNITGGIDYLPKNPVISIQSITAGSKTYREGIDYQLSTDGIDWSLSGDEPSIGSTYQCVYRYNRNMRIGTDVLLVTEGVKSILEFTASGMDGMVDSSRVNVGYDFYLARKDLICLNKDGDPVVIQGKSDTLRLTETPINQNENQLVIGSVLLYPNSKDLTIVNFNTNRLTQYELYNLLRRIEDMEFNQAVSDLDQEAIDGEPATNLRGVYTDGFIGTTKCDVTNADFSAMIDTDKKELTLPVSQYILQANVDSTTTGTTAKKFGQVIMAPFTESVVIDQPKASGTMLVNPYAVYHPMCLVELNPSVDNWIEQSKVVINQEKTQSTTLRRWWYHRGEAWAEAEKQKYDALGVSANSQNGTGKITSKSQTTTTEAIWGDSIQYMRQTTVKVHAENFTPNEQNVECYFNDVLVPLKPAGSTVAGTKSGTVNVNAQGKFDATFTVPSNQPCGTVAVVLKSATSQGTAQYQANGRKQIIQDTVLTTTTVVSPYDPLAQAFQFDEDTVLTKIDLFFATKDPNKAVTVQVRNMINGYPGTTCYATVNVPASDIKVSSDSSTATTVKFNQPVYCHANEQYCFVVLSDSNLYQMFVADLGAKDLITKQFITTQPYTAGVLFSSSNAMTWTAHQSTDLKFKLYKATYTGPGMVIFEDVDSQTITSLVLAAQSVDYKNNGILWEYSVGTTNVWLPLDTYVERDLNATATKIKLRATLNASQNSSVILSANTVNLVGFISKTSGNYVSRVVTMNEHYTKVKVMFEASIITGNSVRVYYQHDKSTAWNELTSPTITPVSEEFNKYEYKLESGLDTIRPKTYRIKLVMSGSNPLTPPRIRKLMSILKY